MLGSLARHSFGTILLAVIIEELGGPEQLARAEALLSRSGWGGTAVLLLLVGSPGSGRPSDWRCSPLACSGTSLFRARS